MSQLTRLLTDKNALNHTRIDAAPLAQVGEGEALLEIRRVAVTTNNITYAAFGDAIFEAVLLDVQKYKPTTFDVPTGNYNAFWLVERDFDNRTSLITDPPDVG